MRNDSEWSKISRESPDSSIFSHPEWRDVILKVEEWKLRDCSFGVYEDGELVGVMPLQFSGVTNRTTSTGWSGSGPIVGMDRGRTPREKIIRFMIEEAKKTAVKNRSSVLDFWILPTTRTSVDNWNGDNPFGQYGLDDKSELSQVIDLAGDEQAVLDNMTADARRILRRASETGVSARKVDWLENLDAYYVMHCETYRRTGVTPHPRSYFSGIASEMATRGHSSLFAAFNRSGETVAFINVAHFARSSWYHTGCSNDEALKSGANYAVMWEAIKDTKARGFGYFDMGAVFPHATDEKQRGLTGFKTKFGGQPRPFFRCETTVTA